MVSRKELEEKESKHRKKIKHSMLELDNKPQRSAIALRYDVEKDAAPVILAAGRGDFAEDILRIAEDHKIPFYEDSGLADLLLKLEISTEVPTELYALVAEVLAFIFRLDQMAARREKLYKRVREMDYDDE